VRPTIARSPLSQYQKGARRPLSLHAAPNQAGHVLALLNGRLRYSRHGHWLLRLYAQQIPPLGHDVRRVANRKNLRVPRHGKV